MEAYRRVADAVAESIAAGRLRPGDRLPPQRLFARRHGIAESTAARVYKELARRGLTVGEVGRGTFVRAAARTPGPALAEPAEGDRVDLELNYPVVDEQSALLADGLAGLMRPDVIQAAMRPVPAVGTQAAREAAVRLLARGGWAPQAQGIVFTGSGRQGIAAAIAALVPPGARLGVEELTYPVVKAAASRLGVTLVPLGMDGDGLVPEAVMAAHRSAPLRAVYLQPTLHNPLSVTMPSKRRAELADLLARLDLYAIEDGIWAFLRDDCPPLAALAPERTILIDSLSKRLAPGLTVGMAVPPAALLPELVAAVHSGGWGPMRFALEAAVRWGADGAVRSVVRAKQRDAMARQELAAGRLGGFAVQSDPLSYYCWWELPRPWRADTFVAAAARRGIAVTPAAAFAAGTQRVPDAVRVGLASPPLETLSRALAELAGIARCMPDDLAAE